jgi:hypothetical protein
MLPRPLEALLKRFEHGFAIDQHLLLSSATTVEQLYLHVTIQL